jgi:tRNA-2-methylthio-N6-dimethylallyladenosine synthase
MNDELITVLSGLNKLTNKLHLPLQSGSDRILEMMNRGYTLEHYYNIVKKLRRARPGIGISTDIIVGFPGESEDDFRQTLAAISEIKFTNVFAFKYSPRPPARAAKLNDDIPREIKEKRLAKVLRQQCSEKV